jgi:hypothetical protein
MSELEMGAREPLDHKIEAEDVIAYLKAHRNFFMEHEQLLDLMQLPKKELGRGVVDFQSFMVERLKNDKKDILNQRRALIENARENMNNMQRIHAAILALLEASSFGECVDVLVQDLPVLLDVDVCALAIEHFKGALGKLPKSGVNLIDQGTVKKLFNGGDAYLQSNTVGDERIFGITAPVVKSVALIRLKIAGAQCQGILAFGSTHPTGFHEDQAIDQIAFLGEIVERCLRSWLQMNTISE